MHAPESDYARRQADALREKLARGETAHLIGIGPAGHNSGVALVRVSAAEGITLIANDEQERLSGIKHDAGFPVEAIEILRSRLEERGLTYRDLHAVVASWDYTSMSPVGFRAVVDHFPASLPLALPSSMPKWDFYGSGETVRAAPARLAQLLGSPDPIPIICQHHHDNHAAASYALSTFGRSPKPTLVTVLDGFGDQGAMSVYLAVDGRLESLRKNYSFIDSLGVFYSVVSSTKGGWTTLSSEGRYMGAAAWGDGSRLTNRFYRGLREAFRFAPEGKVEVNRVFGNWHKHGERQPYGKPMKELLGEPIPPEKMWNPDAVLRVDDVQHSEITRERCDVAAATQLVFEDALFHIVDHFIRETGADQLVLTGGTALNCLANMRLVESYNSEWYRRNLGKEGSLKIWVPPVPGDAGVTVGAACQFALTAGARPGAPMQHAFYCGRGATCSEIEQALGAPGDIGFQPVGNVREPGMLEEIADLAAYIVAHDGVLALYQGPAETGPRALGHRSILANPCNPQSLATINQRVKYRELVRPLAPMVTREAAEQLFVLSDGAADDDYSAYNFMVLTAPARPEAYALVPAVIHKDGTARLQIVRAEHDPFTHAYLRAMGRRVGVEASVNTSFNVGSPIVQTPAQAVVALQRAKALSGLLFISEEGDACLAWHNINV
ncbi:MAG TPA: carbamoyltransferase C-terminal domain-containing protein, partial [Planctomycetaceae bacterium]|nr:carbamoyltransferase C-terminal domain-containing protein [Planctomycetaceae bacterium]